MAKGTDTNTVLDVPVEFAGISIQKEQATVAIKLLKSKLTLKSADHFLCGARLEVGLKIDPDSSDDVAGQETFDAMGTEAFESVADVKSWRASPEHITCSLVFTRSDAEALLRFGQERGRLQARRVGAAGEEKKDDDGE